MSSKYDGSKGTATSLLGHYFRTVAQRAGVQWDSDNEAEIESLVEALITASVQQVRQDLETASILQEAVTHTVHGVLDARAQARRELEALDLQDFAQQPVTQEDSAYVVTLRHVPPVADSLSECPSCLTEIGVLFWRDGKSLVQDCPACGVSLDVWIDYASDELHVHAVGLESPSEAESGGTLEDARRELPVPVSAIAYLMADIAPADEYDTAKQQEARATVIAWLESLEAA